MIYMGGEDEKMYVGLYGGRRKEERRNQERRENGTIFG
jgi:hypothetical protein